MSVYARNGRWYEALDLLHKMREQQSLRNVRNIGSSRVGTSEEAEEASAHKDEAERMKQRPQTLPLPDTITYNVAIRGRWLTTTISCRVQPMVIVSHSTRVAIGNCRVSSIVLAGPWMIALRPTLVVLQPQFTAILSV